MNDRAISTSGSLLVIFIGLFVALGTMVTVVSNTGERVVEAGEDRMDRQSAVQQTQLNITNATWDGTDTLEIRVNNTGSRALSVNETTVLVDGEHAPVENFDTTVEGQDTDVWGLQQQLRLVDSSRTTEPGRVKIVTGSGVAETASVEVL
jgi:flagellar protein FlaF